MTKSKPAPAVPAAPLLQRQEHAELDGQPVKHGDPVLVRNPPDKYEKYMRGSWMFRALVTNSNGDSWIEVFGGKRGHEATRSFEPQRIAHPPTKRKRKSTIN